MNNTIIKKINKNDYRIWFYGMKFFDFFNSYFNENKINEIIAEQLKNVNNDIPALISSWIHIRRQLYDSFVYFDDNNNNKIYRYENEIQYVLSNISLEDFIVSHYAMRIMIASYPNSTFFSWVIENEIQIIMKLIEKAKYIPFVFGEEGFLTYDHLIQKLLYTLLGISEKNLKLVYDYGIRGEKLNVKEKKSWINLCWVNAFSYIQQLKTISLKHGYISIPYSKARYIIYHSLKELFIQKIQQYNKKLDPSQLTLYQNAVKEFFDDITDVTEFKIKDTNIDTIIANSPLCIQTLDELIQSGEQIPHHFALQLSLYIKKFFDVDHLIEYWWKRDKRNKKYATVEEFKNARRDLIYNFNYQYGATGSGVDYRPMKCKTCQSDGRLCFFQKTTSEIEFILKKLYKNQYKNNISQLYNKINIIIKLTKNKLYGLACAHELSLRLEISLNEIQKNLKWKNISIGHPLLQYYNGCYELRKKEKK